MFHYKKLVFLSLFAVLILTSCDKSKFGDLRNNPVNAQERARKNVQEGRGIGLHSKIQAYALQDIGYDTLDANLALGLPADAREYGIAAKMLKEAGVKRVKLMTNNPLKIQGLRNNGIHVERRIEHISGVSLENIHYLSTKGKRMGHILDI